MFDFLSQKFSSIFSSITGQNRLTGKNINDAVQQVKRALIEADIPHDLVNEFVLSVTQEIVGQKVVGSLKPGEQLIKLMHDKLLHFLGGKQATFSFQIPSVTMVMGLQGSGKTTSLGKLANYIQKQAEKRGKKRRILLSSVDFYRPAAVDQLEMLAKQVGVSFYRSSKTDPISAACDIYDYYKRELFELLLLDTAGRLHIDENMLQELRDIDAHLRPRYKLLVLDAMTGQESLNVAQAFDRGIGFQNAILSKMDSDTRGGAAFSFRYALKKPIVFVGTGEKLTDLQQFHPDRMAGKILGQGDILSLIEKADESIKPSDHEKLYKSFTRGKFTLQDFADQMAMMGRIGSLTKLSKYLPGMGGRAVSAEMLEKGELELKKFRAIIGSMTIKERIVPRVLDASRKRRIAQGAGVKVDDVNLLLARFEQTQQYVKLFKGTGRSPRFPRIFS